MRELKAQLISALLVVVTLAAVVCAGINFQQQKKFKLPEDGVTWVDRTLPTGQRVVALYVLPDSQAARAGIRAGDALLKINGSPVSGSLDVTQVLVRLGSWSRAEYIIERAGVELKRTVIVGERTPSPAVLYQYIVGAAYLFLGLFVYFRRGSAPKAIHFYLLCLASFVYCCFHYTGKLNNFDKVIYWGNVIAGVVAPTIFLHFCLSFPEARSRWQRGLPAGILYLPALLLVAAYAAFSSGTLRIAIPLVELNWILDRTWLLLIAGIYMTGACVLAVRARAVQDPVSRQQLKWLRNGALFGLAPFITFYVIPYAAGAIPGETATAAVLSLLLVPLTWAYAILRYRLMDVDVIFQQGYVHTLATIAILGIFYGLVFSVVRLADREH